MRIVQTHPLLRFKCSLDPRLTVKRHRGPPDGEGVPKNSLPFKGRARVGMGNALNDQY